MVVGGRSLRQSCPLMIFVWLRYSLPQNPIPTSYRFRAQCLRIKGFRFRPSNRTWGLGFTLWGAGLGKGQRSLSSGFRV